METEGPAAVSSPAPEPPLSSQQRPSPPLAETMSKSKKEILPMVGMGYTRKIEENYTFVLWYFFLLSITEKVQTSSK